ncbi:retinaldehyde-binding protein 1-like [Maniola jurtina]|uniref:retinaldehyde-binding protein 1-like n=1 Tax=Maniola jurtina TaxID=191418 RepID=UPI001E686D40|nr:retinaldehyde-binding protein 1-like [Maniola jurtina]
MRLSTAIMEAIPKNQILEYNSDTLEFLRKQYELDKPERLEQAISILLDWLNKQDHIVRKNYSKGYLERVIIISKGSVERAKVKLDKIATYRTLLPRFFEPLKDLSKITLINELIITLAPKMTQDHYRVLVAKNVGKKFDAGFMDFYRYLIMICEYVQAYDYCNGIVGVFDYTETNIYEMIKGMNVVDMQQALTIIMEGYGMRVKGIHFITTSKAIDTFIKLFKTALSKKVAERIHVHNKLDTLYKYLPEEILPSDYGGQEKSLDELSGDLKAALDSEHFMKYLKEMQNACTNENYRRDDKFNDQYMGMPGSFRKLTVD